ncbi:glycosyltransferase, MGT family [Actinobacteria bacterium OV450]|nr:glycosyltransferase, MGT family [Actinobacteria bacterium OV450]
MNIEYPITLATGTPPRGAFSGSGATILMVNVAAHGHVNPTLGLVEELAIRGHRVIYAVSDEFGRQVRASGARHLNCFAPQVGFSSHGMHNAWTLAVDRALASIPELLKAFAEDKPDIVLHDSMALAGRVLARHWDRPSVMLASSHFPYRGSNLELLGADWMHVVPKEMRRLSASLKCIGLSLSNNQIAVRPDRAVAFFPRIFQRRADSVSARYVYAGPMLSKRDWQHRWRPVEGNRRVALVSLGTRSRDSLEVFRRILRAFDDNSWHVVLSLGGNVRVEELGRVPPNVEVFKYAPQLRVLACASAFITHAGMGGVMEALSNGVPMALIPQTAEQCINAERITSLRLGVQLSSESTPRAMRNAVEYVTNQPTIGRSLLRMRQSIEQAGGAVRAADYIEGVMRSCEM